MREELQPLLSAVQHNCHIADARHAGDYTLCIYLLKMREYFRWEKNYAFRDRLPEGDVGDWLTQREDLWDSIEDQAFSELPVNDERYDPFDNAALNASLNPLGLVYSGGLGNKCTPHFFLVELNHQEIQSEFNVFVSGKEYARDLTAPPAMALGDTIFIRRESLRRMVWEKIAEWQWNKLENAMGRMIRNFSFEDNLEAALDEMTDTVTDSVLLHEKGEVLAGKHLGPDWESMLADSSRTKAELMIRAVRDHLADTLMTLPGLINQGNDASLHFYYANLPNMHKHLSPTLKQAYEAWVKKGNREVFEAIIDPAKSHWAGLAGEMLERYRQSPDNYVESIQTLVEDNRF